jgi:hypothetical protein
MIDPVMEGNETPASWQSAMIIQVLHCPNCQGTDIVRHGYGLSVLWMEVFCTCSMPSMGRHMRRQLMRNELLDLTTIIPVTAYH